jgi:uncharacterized protein (TIGR04222 family)
MDWIFCVLSVGVAAAAGLAVQWWFSRLGGEVDSGSLGLNEYEIAYLADGAPRAIGAAIASLFQRGLVTVDGSAKTVSATGEVPGMAPPIERAIHSTATPGAQVEDIRKACVDATAPMRERLESLGLIHSEDNIEALRFLAGGVFVAVLIVAWVVIDGSKGIGALAIFAAAGAGFALVARKPLRTRRGSALLSQLASDSAALKETASAAPSVMSGHDIGVVVGLFGASVLGLGPMSDISAALALAKGSCGSCGGGCGGCGGCGCGGCGCA